MNKTLYSISEFVEDFDFFEKESLHSTSYMFLNTIKNYIDHDILLIFPAFFDFEFTKDNKSINYSDLPNTDHYIYYKKNYEQAIAKHLSAIKDHNTVSFLFCKDKGENASYLEIKKENLSLKYKIIANNSTNNNYVQESITVNNSDIEAIKNHNNSTEGNDETIVQSLSEFNYQGINQEYNYNTSTDLFDKAIYNHLPLFENDNITIYYFFTNNLKIDGGIKKGFGGLFVISINDLEKEKLTFFKQINYNLSNKIAINLANRRIKLANIKSAIAAIMSRQTSHNLGSHVVPGTRFDIRNMIQEIANVPYKDIEGISRLLQYIQERMDFISMIVNIDEKDKLKSCLNLKAHVLDEIAMDGPAIRHVGNEQTKCTNYLLRHIIKSEGFYRFEKIEKDLERKSEWWNETKEDVFKNVEDGLIPVEIQLIKKVGEKYKKFTSISNGETDSSDFSKIDLSVPYGVNGRHAFLNIIEDFIRNSAKHNKEALSGLKSLVFSILVQEMKDFSMNENGFLNDDEILISIFANKPSNDAELKEMINSIRSLKLIEYDGTINQEKKGLKEILICLSWLKDKMNNLQFIEYQIKDDKFLNLKDDNSLADYALISNPLCGEENELKHLALRFKLPKYRFLYIIDENIRVKLVGEKQDKPNFKEIFNLPSAELYLLDDEKFINEATLLKKSIPRLILKSELEKTEKIKVIVNKKEVEQNGKKIWEEISNSIENINSTNQSLSEEISTAIYKIYLTNKYGNSLPKLFILRDSQSGLKIHESDTYMDRDTDNLTNVIELLGRDDKAIVFKNHNDAQEQYNKTLKSFNEKLPDFIEGISGNNFTFNLVISNTITELEYCKIVDSSLTKIGIIDERIFEHYSGSTTKFISKDKIKKEFKGELDNGHRPDNLIKILNLIGIIIDRQKINVFLSDYLNPGINETNKNSLIEGIFEIPNTDSSGNNNIYKGKNLDLYNFYIPNDEKDTYCVYDNSGSMITNFGSFDYLSIHFGLVEKYKPDIYKELQERFLKFKEEVLNLKDDSLVKIALHSGRGYLTNLEDFVTFLPVSSIESQMTNCKHLLVQQFSNLKYKF